MTCRKKLLPGNFKKAVPVHAIGKSTSQGYGRKTWLLAQGLGVPGGEAQEDSLLGSGCLSVLLLAETGVRRVARWGLQTESGASG